jgi:cytochrome-b5 reductase
MAPSTLNLVVASALVGATACATWYYIRSSRCCHRNKVLMPALNSSAFKSFVVHSVEAVSHNTDRIRIKLPEDTNTLGLSPVASYILTRFVPSGENAKAVIRPYTPISTEEETQANGYFDLIIKKYPNGLMSTHMCSLKKGDTIDVKGPNLKLDIDKDTHTNIGMIAGGTGITPMMQVIRHIFSSSHASEHKDKHVSLIFSNVEERDILLKTELDQLAKTHPDRFKVYYTVSKPSSNWKGGVGHVTSEMIKTHLPSSNQKDTLIFVCGPPGMMNHVSGSKNPDFTQGVLSGLLKDLKYQENQVFKF